jgi:hypothetical protein
MGKAAEPKEETPEPWRKTTRRLITEIGWEDL